MFAVARQTNEVEKSENGEMIIKNTCLVLALESLKFSEKLSNHEGAVHFWGNDVLNFIILKKNDHYIFYFWFFLVHFSNGMRTWRWGLPPGPDEVRAEQLGGVRVLARGPPAAGVRGT